MAEGWTSLTAFSSRQIVQRGSREGVPQSVISDQATADPEGAGETA